LIVLTPSSAQETLDMTIRAFNLAERFLVPVIILTDEIIGHTRERVVFPTHTEIVNRRAPSVGAEYIPFSAGKEDRWVPARANFGDGHHLLVDGQLHDGYGNRVGHIADKSAALVKRLCAKITDNVDLITDIEMRNTDDAEVIVVSYGSTSRPALRAMKDARAAGMRVGWVKIKTLFPFPEKEIALLAQQAKTFIVPEMNMGKIVHEVERIAKKTTISIPKIGGELRHLISVISTRQH
jgi:2-oxoglutarate ferredoxin oxidoreductase subunit alpha